MALSPVFEGRALRFRITATVLADHLVFCTMYSRAPCPWTAFVTCETCDEIEPADEDGFWKPGVASVKTAVPRLPMFCPTSTCRSTAATDFKKDAQRWALSNVATAKRCD